MMKKILLLALVLFSVIGARAEYTHMVFRTLDGAQHSLGLTDLNITFADGELLASGGGRTLSIELTSLKSMEFASDPSGIEEATPMIQNLGKVSVYAVDGRHVGDFDGLQSACSKLSEGMYVFKSESGLTFKMLIAK